MPMTETADISGTPEGPAASGEPEAGHLRNARRFWVLSIVNWAIALVCWGVSSYLGAARPASMFIYTILFLIAIVALIVGFVCWLVAEFAREVPPELGGAR